jgi:hypothetical protein
MARKYRIEGTKSFLLWTLLLLAIGIWAVKDGWFPSADMLLKHPPDRDANFYIFNKSLAFLSLAGAAICGYIHRIVK